MFLRRLPKGWKNGLQFMRGRAVFDGAHGFIVLGTNADGTNSPPRGNRSHRNPTFGRRIPVPCLNLTIAIAIAIDPDTERAHIIERGISPMTVMDFQLGYSPADLTSPLIEYLDQV